jgi:hypothetical protein
MPMPMPMPMLTPLPMTLPMPMPSGVFHPMRATPTPATVRKIRTPGRWSPYMMSWLLVLILFLWVTGGFGWVDSYETHREESLDWGRAALLVLFWPVYAVAMAARELWQTLRQIRRPRH